jgi:iron(III) transport system substrate-binding protein
MVNWGEKMTRMMGKSLFVAAVLLAASAATPAFAQDWKVEYQKTLDAANEEGELIMQSQPNQQAREFLQREWAAKFPKIKLSMSVIQSPQFAARIRTERSADKYLWDMALSGFTISYAMGKEGILDPVMDSVMDPELKKPELWGGWDEAFLDLTKKYVLATSRFIAGPWYDALKIDPAKVEKQKMKILLDPEYKGKIVWQDPSIQGAGTAPALMLRKLLGDDGLKTLVVDQRVTMVAQQNQVVEAMARGTAWIGIGPPVRPLMGPFVQAGVKTDIRPFGNGPEVNMESIGGSTLFIFNKRPHPNATKVFVNWFLSKDVQYEYAKALQQSARRADVPSVADADQTPVPNAKYIHTQREEDVEPVDEAVRLVGEWRRQVK